MPEGVDDQEDNWDLEYMVTAVEAATTRNRRKSEEVQCVRGDGGKSESMKIVGVTELAR